MTTHDHPRPPSNDEPGPGTLVAIGASAGGLEALERLFSAVPTGLEAAYVVIQHLSPDHKSMMEDLLARHTALPVQTVRDGELLLAGRVYLIPSTHNLSVAGARLRLVPKVERGLNLPIDRFFADAAQVYGRRLVAVVLSGTGSDGTRGARVVNEAGGMVLAQSSETAKFDGMPRNVVATGLVDEVLAPEGIADRIIRFIAGLGPAAKARGRRDASVGDPYDTVVALLSERSRIDFTAYKPGTVSRRIDRRIAARHMGDIHRYLELLRTEPAEIDNLRRDVLIGVTSFLRDPEVFARLEAIVLPAIVKAPRSGDEIRVWVAGCATGEEAYTVAMLLERAMERLQLRRNVKVFATDVEPAYLEIAQAGAYPDSIVADLGDELIDRYFDRDGGRRVIKEEIRRNIVFARHDLTADPPFTRMDLVSCRNTLIYLDASAQLRVLRRFQYSLGPGGWLLLGSSESLGEVQPDFETIENKAKIFRCTQPAALPLDLGRSPMLGGSSARASRRAQRNAEIEAARAQLAERFLPPSVLVSEDRSLLHVFGDATGLLQVPVGAVNLDLSRMLPPRVASVTTSVMLRALREGDEASAEAHDQPDQPALLVRACVVGAQREPRQVLISFIRQAAATQADVPAHVFDATGEATARIRELEDELASSREHLQSMIEELEASNEELQAANEELLASNEELQSTNEELQSVNEELYTVNAEHQEKIEILRQLNADLDAMSRATEIPMLFLDANLNITRFTPAMTGFVALTGLDLGRSLSHFTIQLEAPWLLPALATVVEEGKGFEREVVGRDPPGRGVGQRRFLLRAMPYRTGERGDLAVVVTLVDVTDIERAQSWRAILDALPSCVAVVDRDGVIVDANDAWLASARRNGDSHLRRSAVGADVLAAVPMAPFVATQAQVQAIRAVAAGASEAFASGAAAHSESGAFVTVRRLPAGGAVVAIVDAPSPVAKGG